MKTLTTLTAVAALIAGMSIASAQNAGGPAPAGSSPSNLNAGSPTGTKDKAQSGNESGAAGMKSSGKTAKNITGKGKFCITTAAGSTGMDCKFATMEACQTEAKQQRRQCSPNPNMGGTTGMK
jgi:hypothetical protein